MVFQRQVNATMAGMLCLYSQTLIAADPHPLIDPPRCFNHLGETVNHGAGNPILHRRRRVEAFQLGHDFSRAAPGLGQAIKPHHGSASHKGCDVWGNRHSKPWARAPFNPSNHQRFLDSPLKVWSIINKKTPRIEGESECVKSELCEEKNLEGPYKRTPEMELMSDQNLKVV